MGVEQKISGGVDTTEDNPPSDSKPAGKSTEIYAGMLYILLPVEQHSLSTLPNMTCDVYMFNCGFV